MLESVGERVRLYHSWWFEGGRCLRLRWFDILDVALLGVSISFFALVTSFSLSFREGSFSAGDLFWAFVGVSKPES